MSKLQKLMIQGVRAFNPKDQNVLEFYTPLTLIVGANGTGKTTIIECLKYITTGEMPPNSRGGAFIYDPKMAREIDIKAEIKLKFINMRNELLICTRSIQSTLKKGKIEQKTLDTSLLKEEGNKNILIGSKLADIDRDIPKHLGVSHSILNNVIFCHQDESTWPLNDPTICKKKLDDIFASTKYNKALLGLKATKKEITADLKLKEQQLNFLFKDKIKRDEILNNIEQYNIEVEKKKQKLKIFHEEIERISINIDQLQSELSIWSKIELNHKILNDEFESCKKFVKNFAYDLLSNEIIDNRDIIIDKIQSMENKLDILSKSKIEVEFFNIESLRRKAMEEESKNNKICSKISLLKHQIEKDKSEKSLNENWIFNEFPCKENDLLGKIKESFNFVEQKILEKTGNLEKIKNEYFERKSKYNEANRIYKENQDFINRYKHLKIQDIDINLNIEIDCEKQIELEASVYELIEEYNLKQQQLDDQYKLSKESFRKVELLEEINRLKDILSKQRLEDIQSILTKKTTILNQQKEIAKSYEREKQILDIKIENEEASNEKILGEIKNCIIQLRAYENFNNQINSLKNIDLNQITHETLKSTEMLTFLKPEVLRDVKNLQNEIKECDNIISASNHAASVYRNFSSLGQKRNECPLCKKELSASEKIAYVGKLERVIDKIPESIKNAQEKKQRLEESLHQIKKNNATIETSNLIKEEITKLIENISFSARGSSLSMNKNEIEQIMVNITNLELEIATLNSDLKDYHAFTQKLKQLEDEYDRLPDFVDFTQVKNSLEETKSLLEEKKRELTIINADIKEKEKLRHIFQSEIENRKLISQRDQKILQNAALLESDLNKNVIDDLEKIISTKEISLNTLKSNFIRKKMEAEMRLKKIEDAENRIVENETKIIKLKSEITSSNELVTFDGEKITTEMVKNDKNYEKYRLRVLDYKNDIIKLNKMVEDEKRTLKNIEENIRLKKTKQRALEIEKELQNYDSKKFSMLSNKLESYKDKKIKITSNESIIRGELKQLGHTIKCLSNELEANYIDTVKNYLRASVEMKILELSVDDLEKCINALDKAIVDFHQSKIEEVNRLLKNLWSSTYRGNDVDYIELRSESSEARAYNYRIIMVKNGVELDMRGRSSAGQKMIASILFRISLADVYCSGFNVITLDEPTTNLDKDNIESLAYTLSKIIKDRKNVQMVVITHDEEFVETLNREGIEYFYRLRRDSKGNSHIERHSIY